MFPAREIAPVLRRGFVEARLHTDMTEKHDGFAKFNKRIQQVRVQYLGAGNTGLPYYFVFDPKKLDTPLSSLAGLGSKREFLDFFQSAQQKVSKAGGD